MSHELNMNTHTHRPTWTEIDLTNLIHNLQQVREIVSAGTEIMPVVKANAYGHGIYQISKALVDNGVKYLGVATIDEALYLRDKDIKVPILVMGSLLKEEAEVAIDNGITMTLCDDRLCGVISEVASKTGKKAKVHIKVDTGMGRIGVWYKDAIGLITKAVKDSNIEIEGIYTHYSSAARDVMYTEMQIEHFEYVLDEVDKAGIEIKYRHAANSIAVVDWKNTRLNLVRSGILIYGIYPKEDFRKIISIKPVMSLKTRIVYLKDTPTGRAISYGRTYITQKDTKIATIPIGYADGYGRILSNKAEALVRGKHVRIVGIVTMDQTMLDVGNIPDVEVGDEVVLIGSQKDAEIPIERVSRLAKTIPYEILAGITDRVPRIYRG